VKEMAAKKPVTFSIWAAIAINSGLSAARGFIGTSGLSVKQQDALQTFVGAGEALLRAFSK
jgi:hypothetical protein